MRMHRSISVGVGIAALLALASPAWATLDNLKAYKQAYPDKAAKASCKICHEGVMGNKDNLNAHGKALQNYKGAGKALKLTADDYKAAEQAGITPESSAAQAAPGGDAGSSPKGTAPAAK